MKREIVVNKEYYIFIDNEVRYSSLKLLFPEHAEKLFKQAEDDAKNRYNIYKKLSE